MKLSGPCRRDYLSSRNETSTYADTVLGATYVATASCLANKHSSSKVVSLSSGYR